MPLHHAQTVLQKNLPRLVREAGYPTMELFAHENGIEKSTISRIITGARDPKLATLDRIRSALEISWARLLEEPCRSSSQANSQSGEIAAKRSLATTTY